MEDEPEKYQSHFSVYLKSGLEPDSIEEMYKKVHVAIRAYPSPKKSGKQPPKQHKRCLIVNAQEIDHNMKNASAIVEFINSICTYINRHTILILVYIEMYLFYIMHTDVYMQLGHFIRFIVKLRVGLVQSTGIPI